jgi:hypothetical protein
VQIGYFGDCIGRLSMTYPEKNQKHGCNDRGGHRHPGQDPGATSRSGHLFVYPLAKFSAWREVPAGPAQRALQPGCIRNLRGTPRAPV